MDKKAADAVVISALKNAKGIGEARPLLFEDRQKIMDIELDAENRSLMGLGKVVNTGIRDVMECHLIYVALSNMDFDWGCPTLVLKKGQEVVGEEVRDEEVIVSLSNQKNVWFMHKNFVVYKDKISFPQDIMKKICQFETPSLPANGALWKMNGFNAIPLFMPILPPLLMSS